jgi:DNA polymerase III sliding clamp (beta) subunit (PCNA family)
MIEAVDFAVDRKEGGKVPAFKGINLRSIDGNLCVVGCDGKQIAVAKTEFVDDIELTIPFNAASAFSKFARDSAEVDIIAQENHVCVRSELGHVIANKLDSKYPAWQTIIPENVPHSASVSIAELSKVIRRASLSSGAKETENSPAQSVRFTFGEGELVIEAKDIDSISDATESIPISCDTLQNFIAMGVAGGQVLDALAVIGADSDTALLEFSTDKAPLVVRPGKPLPFEYTFVTMPVILKW